MDYNISSDSIRQDIVRVQQAFLTRVYGWMVLGLFLTAITSLLVAGDEQLMYTILRNKILFYGILIAQFGIVIFLSARIEKMKATTAAASFIIYSILTGITLSTIFFIFTTESIVSTFFICSGTFGAMALYGYLTKRDLSGVGSFMMMGLFGIVIASLVNIFMPSEQVSWLISFVAVVVFTGLTAYDTQKMKAMAYVMMEGNELARKGAIIGALRLYLDFINLFLALLRLLGNRR